MKSTKYIIKTTNQFKKDFKLAMKRGCQMSLLEDVISDLANDKALPAKNKDHALSDN